MPYYNFSDFVVKTIIDLCCFFWIRFIIAGEAGELYDHHFEIQNTQGDDNENRQDRQKHLKRGNDPTIPFLKEKYASKTIMFEEKDDQNTSHYQAVDVYYIIVGREIHRLSMNRTPFGYLPTYIHLNGRKLYEHDGGPHQGRSIVYNQQLFEQQQQNDNDFVNEENNNLIVQTVTPNSGIMEVAAEEDETQLQYKQHQNQQQEQQQLNEVKLKESMMWKNEHVTFYLKRDIKVTVVSNRESLLRHIACSGIQRSPSSHKLYINDRCVEDLSLYTEKERSYWWILFFILIFPVWVVYFLVVLMIVSPLKICLCCCLRRKSSLSRFRRFTVEVNRHEDGEEEIIYSKINSSSSSLLSSRNPLLSV